MFSVVISALNPGPLVRRAVMSCLRSMPNDAELVFHLDPSNDDSTYLLQAITDKRFRLVQTMERLGFAGGLNFAIDQSKHDLIARIDADDIALPWRWRYQVPKMRNLDLHFGSLLHLYKLASLPIVLPHYPVSLNTQEFAAVSRYQNPGFHPAAMFNRQAFLEVGGYRNALAEDYDLWLRMLAAGKKVSRGLLPVTIYRHHHTQATAGRSWELRVSEDRWVRESQEMLIASFDGDLSKKTLRCLLIRQPWSWLEFRRLPK